MGGLWGARSHRFAQGLSALAVIAALCLAIGCGGDSQAAAADGAGERLVLGTPVDRSSEPVAPTGAPNRSAPDARAPVPIVPVSDPRDATGKPSPQGRKDAPAFDPDLQKRIAAEVDRGIRAALKAATGRLTAKDCQIAVHVVLPDGQTLVAIQSRRPLRPASNLKILTAYAAWTLLGSDHVIETRFDAAGVIRDGRLVGDLVARAGGDALLDHGGDGSLTRWIDDLAAQLRRSGIEEIEGDLVLDEAAWPTPAPGPGWPSDKEHWKAYCALAGGFSANSGCLTATCVAGPVGGRSESRVRPKYHGLERIGTVDTVSKGAALNIAIEARGQRVVVRGKQPVDASPWDTRMAHPDPVNLFGHAITGGLRARGISVNGFRRVRQAPTAPRVASLQTPWVEWLVPILRDSDNATADQLFLHLGHMVTKQPDWDGGASAVTQALKPLGVTGGEWALMDGSGLSQGNRVRARQLTAAMADLERRGDAQVWFDAMPLAGKTGKLSSRMRGGPAMEKVRAKTGFIGGASGLSGRLETTSGEVLLFSILVNYPRVAGLNTRAWKPMQDRICEVLTGWEAPDG
jgi:serine-type D-Ala-D-Ala carboxypeptidase/endopeptidase (penicillin-binding protein 4)